MTVKHHFTLTDTTEVVRRQTAIHRKCLMLLRTKQSRSLSQTLSKAS